MVGLLQERGRVVFPNSVSTGGETAQGSDKKGDTKAKKALGISYIGHGYFMRDEAYSLFDSRVQPRGTTFPQLNSSKEDIMSDYLLDMVKKTKATPQEEPIPGRNDQVKNSAGGYVFETHPLSQLQRFLILGSEGGTFYVSEAKLTREHCENVYRILGEHPLQALELVRDIIKSGRAPKIGPSLFVLALAASHDNPMTRRQALSMVGEVCRIPTHLFMFMKYVQSMRGWGRGLRRAVADWYRNAPIKRLAYHAVKYRNREGFTHRDALRLSHPKPLTDKQNRLFRWITQAEDPGEDPDFNIIHAYRKAKSIEDPRELVDLIKEFSLPREAIPTKFLKDKIIWDALLPSMPLTALIRNLGNMTAYGTIRWEKPTDPPIVPRLLDREHILNSKVHPIQILNALITYHGGTRLRGGTYGRNYGNKHKDWTPVSRIVDALNQAFYLSFGNVEPTGKRIMLALDVSASMGWDTTAGTNLTPAEASAALALVNARRESACAIMAFSDQFRPVCITSSMRLSDVVSYLRGFAHGRTNCALPMIHAMEKSMRVDCFVIYTDSETWVGRKMHPVQALNMYREKSGIPAKLVVVGMTGDRFTIADP